MNLIELRNLYRENLNNFSFKESDYLLNILLKENFNLESTFINLNPDYKLKESQINKILIHISKSRKRRLAIYSSSEDESENCVEPKSILPKKNTWNSNIIGMKFGGESSGV